MMSDVGTECSSVTMMLNSEFPVTAIKDIASVSVEGDQDQVVCALADGRVLPSSDRRISERANRHKK